MPPPPGLTTRREFLERSAAAAALLALPWAAGCASGSDRRIVRAAIHPTIGVARVGNSPDSFFFGPEVPGALPRASGGLQGRERRRRQAGRPVPRLRARRGRPSRPRAHRGRGGHHLARLRREHEGGLVRLLGRRTTSPTRRRRRCATRTSRSESGSSSSRANAACAAPGHARSRSHGSFLGVDVDLGELMTDGDGRLVLLPGPGRAYSTGNHPLTTFSGNDGWTDDVCDGPVHATVRIDGRTIEAEPAWALVTPPNYGPGMADRPRHAVRRGALDVRRVGRARRRRGQLRRRHPPDLRAHDRDAVGQRGLLPAATASAARRTG